MAINDPSHGAFGAPDFIVQRGSAPIGHVECKNVGANLDQVEKSDQLHRYLDALPNLILTDYLEFRWYVRGQLRDKARLGRFLGSDGLRLDSGGRSRVHRLLEDFFNAEEATVTDPADLARRMAGKARLLRDVIEKILDKPSEGYSSLTHLLKNYKEVLIRDLNESQFADLQAQTAVYGLFAARCAHRGPERAFTLANLRPSI